MVPNVTVQQLIFTARIITVALMPTRTMVPFPKNEPAAQGPLCPGGHIPVKKQNLTQLCSNLRSYLNLQQELRLFFEGALAPAAPFLLFRLKREGFSCCLAWVDKNGLYIEAKS